MSQSARGRRVGAGVSANGLLKAVIVGTALLLGACGGGGGGGGGGGATEEPNYVPGDGPGTAVLSWSAPTQREDGSPLTSGDIAKFRIHFGPATDPTQYLIDVTDATQTQYTITGLDRDTWQFVMTVVDTAGQESGESNSMSKTIE